MAPKKLINIVFKINSLEEYEHKTSADNNKVSGKIYPSNNFY